MDMQANQSQDLARTTFQLLALGALIATSFWIVRPFIEALAWATMIVVSTWPLLLHAQAWLGGRRSLAVALMTITLLLILVVPLYLGLSAIVENAKQVADWSKSVATLHVPQPPSWLAGLPVVGAKLAARWQYLAAAGSEELSARLAPYGQKLVLWFVGQVGGVGLLLLQFLLTVIIAAILYANGETAARGADRFARRLAGLEGVNAVHLAGQAIRGVALGVVLTAIVQAGLVGLGLAAVAVPFAVILTVVAFILAIAQLGVVIVLMLVPIVIWVYSTSGAGWGTGFLVWAIFCNTIDNFLRPLLIKRGVDLPILLVFSGVIGGLIAFGVIGLFIGPVVLAVAYMLLVDWVSESTPAAEQEQPPAPKASKGMLGG
jgi:predicted PurR-regulated permease PerM